MDLKCWYVRALLATGMYCWEAEGLPSGRGLATHYTVVLRCWGSDEMIRPLCLSVHSDYRSLSFC